MIAKEATVEKEKVQVRIAAELEAVRKRHGGILRPADVVEFAADPDTALHARFAWDDATAGYQYRLWQARELIRVCVVVLKDDTPEVRAYVSLKDDRQEEGGGYRTTASVLRDPEMRAALLAQAKEDMKRFEREYDVLTELADVFAAMRKVR